MSRHLESKLQIACVRWYRYSFPEAARLLIHVPNGGYRNATEAKRLMAEGVVAGVADLVLFVPRHGFHALFIELKVDKNKQSTLQKEWERVVKEQGYDYRVVYTLEQFINLINAYLK
jgi:hypothetical protein